MDLDGRIDGGIGGRTDAGMNAATPFVRGPLEVPHAVHRPDRIPAARYYDPHFFDLERERLWPRVWQMACRLDEIPQPGDFVEYEILGLSVLIVRLDEATIKAYHNACRHRGMQLAKGRGTLRHGIECPFHGWCWSLDGSSRYVYEPSLFDASQLDREDLRLRECRLETWGGCAFINFDLEAPPLRASLEPFADYHDAHHVESMKAEWWRSTVLPVNWKLALEAFTEGYHALRTHPQLLARTPEKGYGAGTNTAGFTDPADVIESSIYFMKCLSEGMGGGMIHAKDIRVAEGLRDLDLPSDGMQAILEWNQKLNDEIVRWSRNAGIPIPDLNALVAAGHVSSVNFGFPNYFLLPVYGNAVAYRIRPLAPEETLFEVWSLTLHPEGESPPVPGPPVALAWDDPSWPEVLRQDFTNLPRQQAGLRSPGFEFMRLSESVEGLIGNFHCAVDGYLAGLDHGRLLPAIQRVSGGIDAPLRDLGLHEEAAKRSS